MNDLLLKISNEMKECANIILFAERNDAMVNEKSGHANFVTTYDKKVQEELKRRLKNILPEAIFVGEEADFNGTVDTGFAFIVDPIDGTTNFIKDYKTSCISVGLLKDGEQYMGAVYNPYLDELFTAVKGEGAYLNDKPIHVTNLPLSDGIVIFGTSPYYEELSKQSFDLAYKIFKQSLDVRRSGSAAIDLCNIAAGRAELFFELRLSPWDYAAGSLIVSEAGGLVTTVDGDKLQFLNPTSVMATNGVAKYIRE